MSPLPYTKDHSPKVGNASQSKSFRADHLRLVWDAARPLEAPRARRSGGDVKVGDCILGTIKKTPRWRSETLFVRRRLAELERLVETRHGGPCDTDDGEIYLEAALPHLAALPADDFSAPPSVLWAYAMCPRLVSERGLDWIAEREARYRERPRRLTADAIARLLAIYDVERERLELKTIGAIDKPKAQRIADRKAKAAKRARQWRERKKLERLAAGEPPRRRSISAEKPWKAEGISKTTWYDRRQKERLKAGSGQSAYAINSVATNCVREVVRNDVGERSAA